MKTLLIAAFVAGTVVAAPALPMLRLADTGDDPERIDYTRLPVLRRSTDSSPAARTTCTE
jgi:hypothetical protein